MIYFKFFSPIVFAFSSLVPISSYKFQPIAPQTISNTIQTLPSSLPSSYQVNFNVKWHAFFYIISMQSLAIAWTYGIWVLRESGFFFYYFRIFGNRKINTALVKQSPQKQFLLSFIYFYRVYFSYSQKYIYLLWDLGLHLFSQMA